MDDILTNILKQLLAPRYIFVSYHHDENQFYYDALSRLATGSYGLVHDNSLDRTFDSDNPEYVIRRIREQHINGTSCTIVLCGPGTRWRKYVDWEIKASLDAEHGLLGVHLPNNPADYTGGVSKPDRLQDNLISGYAVWVQWQQITTSIMLKSNIEAAVGRPTRLIDNSRPLRGRNGPP